jgi:hypothetical protein
MVMTTEEDIRLAVTDGQREYLQSKLDQYTGVLLAFQQQAKDHVLSGIIMPDSEIWGDEENEVGSDDDD